MKTYLISKKFNPKFREKSYGLLWYRWDSSKHQRLPEWYHWGNIKTHWGEGQKITEEYQLLKFPPNSSIFFSGKCFYRSGFHRGTVRSRFSRSTETEGTIDYWGAILNSPEGLDSWAYFSFCMICLHFFIKQLKDWCYILWDWFITTYLRCCDKSETNWIFVHYWNPIHHS